jgi:CRP/FNR family transcriptional regulator
MNKASAFEPRETAANSRPAPSGLFSHLSPAAQAALESIKSNFGHPPGSVLFVERQESCGVFMLFEGLVKLSISSSEGKTLILRIVRPGEIIGLMPTLSGSPYEATAETIQSSQVAFIRRDDFLRFVSQYPEAYESVVRQLGMYYHGACQQLRTLGLTSSAPEKVAKFLLDSAAAGQQTSQGVRFHMALTHEQIAELIGTSRETVTRTLSQFRSRRLVAGHGSMLMIPNRAALESFVTA